MIDNMKAVEENANPSLHDSLEDEADDDTFSLSEFLMSRETSNTDEDELIEDHSFEFFSTEEQNHNRNHDTSIKNNDSPKFSPENIIFCGNIIPTKKPFPEKTSNQKEKCQSRTENLSSMEKLPSTKKRIENMKKGGGGKKKNNHTNNVMAHKVTILRSSARWHLYAFGMNKLPMEMELSDIKNRQSRRLRPIHIDQSQCSSDKLLVTNEKVSIGCSNSNSDSNSTRSGGKGIWGIIREFGCNDHANTVVKASLVCIPRV